jgi:hypothetical protein
MMQSPKLQQNAPAVPQQESTSEVASHLLEECRMVLPGIQALFGFQLIAVFNGKFWELPESHRMLHLVAITLVAISVALVMTPAAYHRQAHQFSISRQFVRISSLLLLLSMFPLSVGICIDFYVVCALVLANAWWSSMLTGGLAAIFLWLWYIFPRLGFVR